MHVYILTDKETGVRTSPITADDVDQAHEKAGLQKGQTYVQLVS